MPRSDDELRARMAEPSRSPEIRERLEEHRARARENAKPITAESREAANQRVRDRLEKSAAEFGGSTEDAARQASEAARRNERRASEEK